MKIMYTYRIYCILIIRDLFWKFLDFFDTIAYLQKHLRKKMSDGVVNVSAYKYLISINNIKKKKIFQWINTDNDWRTSQNCDFYFTSLHSTLKIALREKPVKVLRADCTKLKKFL